MVTLMTVTGAFPWWVSWVMSAGSVVISAVPLILFLGCGLFLRRGFLLFALGRCLGFDQLQGHLHGHIARLGSFWNGRVNLFPFHVRTIASVHHIDRAALIRVLSELFEGRLGRAPPGFSGLLSEGSNHDPWGLKPVWV